MEVYKYIVFNQSILFHEAWDTDNVYDVYKRLILKTVKLRLVFKEVK